MKPKKNQDDILENLFKKERFHDERDGFTLYSFKELY